MQEDRYKIKFNQLLNLSKREQLNKHDLGLILELYVAIEQNGYIFGDLPIEIRKKYDYGKRDEGVDVCVINEQNDIIKYIQCKNYNHYLKVGNLECFTWWLRKYNCYDISEIIINETCHYSKKIEDFCKVTRVKTNDFKPYTINKIEVSKEIKLRDYQIQCLKMMKRTNNKEFTIKIPCGCGKSLITLVFSKLMIKRFIILVPTIILAQQFKELFNNYGIEVRTFWTNNENKGDLNSRITICVYDSIVKIPENEQFDYVVIDEAHHYEYTRIYKHQTEDYGLKSHVNKLNYSQLIKLSATIDNPDFELSLNTAINNGYICNYEVDIQILDVINYNSILKILEYHKEYFKCLIYCSRVETVKELNNYLNENGIKSDFITSEININDRKKILENSDLRCVINCQCLSEGVNIPCFDTAILYDDIKSDIRIVQVLGRLLRKDVNNNMKVAKLVILQNVNDTVDKLRMYLKSICKEDGWFKQRNQYITYQHIIDERNEEIENKMIEMESSIIKTIKYLNRTDDEKIEFCEEFYEQFHRLPKQNEIYKSFKIGIFISNLKRGKNKHLKPIVLNIFGIKEF